MRKITPKILIIAPPSIAQTVMIQPLLQRLHVQHGGAIIDVLAPTLVAPVLRRMAEIRNVIDNPLPYDKLRLRARWRFTRQLRPEKYHRAIVLPHSFASALIPFFAGIRLRTGHQLKGGYFLLNDRRRLDEKELPLMTERFAALAGMPRAPLQRPVANPVLTTDDIRKKAALAKFHLVPRGPVVALCVGSEYGPARRWPARYFADLSWKLSDAGYEVWLLGTAEDAQTGIEIERMFAISRVKNASMHSSVKHQNFHNLCGKATLSNTIDLLAAADLSVTNDSNLMHVAAALGNPLIALFGSSSPDLAPPLSDRAQVIYLKLPCSPCFQHRCPLGHFNCMTQIRPKRLFDEIVALGPHTIKVPVHAPLSEPVPPPHHAFAPSPAPHPAIEHESDEETPARHIPPVTQSKGFEFIQGLAEELSSNKLVFPTSLNATMHIRHALMDPDSSVAKVAHIVGAEPVLSAQLLRLCNSAAFNVSGKPISELRTAIVRLGYTMVHNVAISVGMRQLLQAKSHGTIPPVIEGLWKRSIRIAALCYATAKRLTRLNPDTAMLAGLLHDIGKFYILNRARDYAELFTTDKALWEIVDQWHAHIGQAILESWEIPEEIDIAVRDHRDFSRTHAGPPDLTDVVSAADFLDRMYHAKNVQQVDWDTLPPAFHRLNLQKENSMLLMQETRQEIAEIVQALS